MRDKIYCQCGKESVKCETSGNVRAIKKATGFNPLFLKGDGLRIAWLCPECAKKAEDLALKLLSISKDVYTRLAQFIPREKRVD